MDTRDLLENLKVELTCPICLGYFTDPVTVKCGHSFCRECLLQCKEGADGTLTCPECRRVIRNSDLVPNKSLQNLSVTGKILRPHLLQSMVGLTTCDQHGEKEKFFCEEDRRLLCDSCLLAPEHKDHHVLPLEAATDKCKGTWTMVQKKQEDFKMALDKVRRRGKCCKEDTYTLKKAVGIEYVKMHYFSWDEECEYWERLDEEFRDNLFQLENTKAELSQQVQHLQQMIVEVCENLDKVPLGVLQI